MLSFLGESAAAQGHRATAWGGPKGLHPTSAGVSLLALEGVESPTPGNSNQVPSEALLLCAALPTPVLLLQTQIRRPKNGKWLVSKDSTHKTLVACCLPAGM